MNRSLLLVSGLLVANAALLVICVAPGIAEDAPSPHVVSTTQADDGPTTYVPISGSLVSTSHSCAGPILDIVLERPHWTLRFDARTWVDDGDGEPDELTASITVDASGARWSDPGLQQTLALSAADNNALLHALDLSCVRPDDSPAKRTGEHFDVAYDTTGPSAFELSDTSPAGQQIAALFAAAREHYVAGRIGAAREAKISLRGSFDATPVAVAVADGDLVITDNTGTSNYPSEADRDAVDAFDWALSLPTARADGPAFTGRLTVAGATRAIVFARSAFDALPPELRKHVRHAVLPGRILTWLDA